MRTIKSKKSLLVAIAATVGLMAVAPGVFSPAMAGMSSGDFVTFLGEPMIAIKGDAGGMTAAHRAWVAQDNFDNALATAVNKSPSAVEVFRERNAYTVRLDGKYILSADAASALASGMSAKDLADFWAAAMREKLANAEATARYVASLRDEHPLKANVSVTENELVRAETGTLPFRMAEGSLSVDPDHQGQVLLVLDKAVTVQQGILPEKCVLYGSLLKRESGKPYIAFNTCQYPDGHTLVLKGVVAETYVHTDAPHLVCTQSIPANELTGAREPASIGIGAQEADIAVIEQESGMVAATGPGPM